MLAPQPPKLTCRSLGWNRSPVRTKPQILSSLPGVTRTIGLPAVCSTSNASSMDEVMASSSAPATRPGRSRDDRDGVSRSGLVVALERIGLPALAFCVLTLTVVGASRDRELAIDFKHVSPSIRGLAHGVNPYAAQNVGLGGHFLWTVLAGWLLAPFAWVPGGYLAVVGLEAAGIAGAAVLLGVRDWRLIAIALAWPATVNSVQTGNISVLILVFLAAAWHDRERARSGLWAGLAVGVKLFAWPVLVWLAATRRWQALGLALLVQLFTLAITLPYISLGSYIRFERDVDRTMASQALTLDALARRLGATPHEGMALALVVGLTILWFGRRDLGWVVVAMLVLSPVVWLHYFGLLMIPLALWTRSLLLWSIPFLFVLVPGQGNGALWQTAAALLILALVAGTAWRDRSPGLMASG
jgi:Glycosyltransferase family 87